MKKPETFLTVMPEEGLGEWLYGYTAHNSLYNGAKYSTNKLWKHPFGIFLLLIAAFLVFWFVCSVVFTALDGGSVLIHLSSGFAVFVIVSIILLSVFNGWGRLMQLQASMKARGKSDNGDYKKEREEQEKLTSSFNVFPNHIVLKSAGEEKVIARSCLETVKLLRGAEGYSVTFVSSFGEEIPVADLTVPFSQYKQLKTIFKDRLTVKNGENAFGGKYAGKKIAAPVIFGAVFIALALYFGLPIFLHFKSFREFLCGFDALNAGLVFFFAIGVIAAASGITALIKLVIYKVDKS